MPPCKPLVKLGIRSLRAWREARELIDRRQDAGRLEERSQPKEMSSTVALSQAGIPRMRSAMAQTLDRVPEDSIRGFGGGSR